MSLTKAPGSGGLSDRPGAELAQEQPSGHGMEFLGGPRELRVKRLPQLFRRQELEAAAQDAFQPRFEAAQGFGGQVGEPPGAAVGVEQQVLCAIRGRFKVTPRLG